MIDLKMLLEDNCNLRGNWMRQTKKWGKTWGNMYLFFSVHYYVIIGQ